MELSFTQKKSIRKNFGRLKETLSIPNLIEVQKNSFNEFITKTAEKNNSIYSKGLTKVFESVFPINDASEKEALEFISYRLGKPKFDVTECRQRSLTYSAALKATLRLVVYDIDNEENTKQTSFGGHLTELRSRLLKSIIYIFIFFVISYTFAESIYSFLVQPYADAVKEDQSNRRLIFTALHETFITYLKVAFLKQFL